MQSVFRRTALRETGAELYYIPEDPDDSEDEEEKLPELDFDEAGLGLPTMHTIVEAEGDESVISGLPVILLEENDETLQTETIDNESFVPGTPVEL